MTSTPLGKCGALYFKNFKAFGPSGQTLPLSRINLLFGPNSSGKSSVFQGIHLITDGFSGKNLGRNRYSTSVHKGQTQLPFVIGLSFIHPKAVGTAQEIPWLFFQFSQAPADRIRLDHITVAIRSSIHLTFGRDAEQWTIRDCAIDADALRRLDSGDSLAFPAPLSQVTQRSICDELRLSQISLSSPHSATATRLSMVAPSLPIGIAQIVEQSVAHAARSLMHLGNNVVHLRPIRKIPTRDELLAISTGPKTDLLDDLETVVWQKLLDASFRDGAYLEETNLWLGKAGVDLGYKLHVREASKIAEGAAPQHFLVVQDTNDPTMQNVDLDLTDVGVGISQVIPVVGTCCAHNEMWILVEQPELHLHPRAQCALADVFVAKTKDVLFVRGQYNGGNIFFLETHSEHLMLRLLRRIRATSEGRLSDAEHLQLRPEDVSVLYFESTVLGVVIHHMRITPDGDFVRRWPEGFFPERTKELFD